MINKSKPITNIRKNYHHLKTLCNNTLYLTIKYLCKNNYLYGQLKGFPKHVFVKYIT